MIQCSLVKRKVIRSHALWYKLKDLIFSARGHALALSGEYCENVPENCFMDC